MKTFLSASLHNTASPAQHAAESPVNPPTPYPPPSLTDQALPAVWAPAALHTSLLLPETCPWTLTILSWAAAWYTTQTASLWASTTLLVAQGLSLAMHWAEATGKAPWARRRHSCTRTLVCRLRPSLIRSRCAT